jgi:hypothetical protein
MLYVWHVTGRDRGVTGWRRVTVRDPGRLHIRRGGTAEGPVVSFNVLLAVGGTLHSDSARSLAPFSLVRSSILDEIGTRQKETGCDLVT